MKFDTPDRRTVLKGIGAGMIGSVVSTGLSGAESNKGPGQNKTQTWADDTIFDLLDADLYSADKDNDNEGNEEAHEPLYHIAPTNLPNSHSPHFAGLDLVAPLPPGFNGDTFTAQWHIKFVVDGQGNMVNQTSDGTWLTNAGIIESAADDPSEDIAITSVEFVFTCPIATHAPPGHTHD